MFFVFFDARNANNIFLKSLIFSKKLEFRKLISKCYVQKFELRILFQILYFLFLNSVF